MCLHSFAGCLFSPPTLLHHTLFCAVRESTFLGIDDIGANAASVLTGAAINDNHVLISGGEDGGTPVAIGFHAKRSNGKHRYYWLYRVKFGISAANLAAKGDSITLYLRRNCRNFIVNFLQLY
jgi:hypothetical protein